MTMQPPVSCARPRDNNMETPQAVIDPLTDSLCAASIIHELNNPLTAIKMGLEQLGRTPSLEALLAPMIEAQERAASLIESLYQLYQGITPEKTLITPLELKTTLETLLRTEPQRSANVQFEMDPATQIWGHPRLLSQVLLNLIKNAGAAKASIIQIQVSREDKSAVIAVHDNGPGFPAELQKKPFKPFQKGQGTSGLGMGLYLSHIIVLAHQGTLAIEAEEGQGTTFTIRLPSK